MKGDNTSDALKAQWCSHIHRLPLALLLAGAEHDHSTAAATRGPALNACSQHCLLMSIDQSGSRLTWC